jgi:hypothetical protein
MAVGGLNHVDHGAALGGHADAFGLQFMEEVAAFERRHQRRNPDATESQESY